MPQLAKIIKIPDNNPIRFIEDNSPTKGYETYNGDFFAAMLQVWDYSTQRYMQQWRFDSYIGVQIQIGGAYKGVEFGVGSTRQIWLEILDCSGKALATLNPTNVNTVTGNTSTFDGVDYQLTTLNWQFSFGSYVNADDKYFLRIKLNYGSTGNIFTDYYTSEPLHVSNYHQGLRLIEYTSFSNKLQTDYRSGMFFHLLVPADLVLQKLDNTITQYRDQEENPRKQSAIPLRFWTLKMGYKGGLPAWFYDKVNHAVSNDYVLVDKTRLVATETVQIGAAISKYKRYAGSVELAEYDKDAISTKAYKTPQVLFTTGIYPRLLYYGTIRGASGGAVVYWQGYEINNAQDEVNFITAANNYKGGGVLKGYFAITSGKAVYFNGDGEAYNDVITTFFTKALYLDYSRKASSLHVIPYIQITGKRAAVVYDSPSEVYEMGSADGGAPNVSATFTRDLGANVSKTVRIWHDDNIVSLKEENASFTKGNGDLYGITGTAPAGLQLLNIANFMGASFNMSIWPTTLLTLIINRSAVLNNITGFGKNWENLSLIFFDQNVLTSTNIDSIFNTFVNATIGLEMNGIFRINNQVPPAPPTGASSATRSILTGQGWTVTTD